MALISTLKNSYEFGLVFENRAFFKTSFLNVFVMDLASFKKKAKRKIESFNLIGFSISKKVAIANKRNLLKRRIKSIIYEYSTQKIGFCVVFICKKGITDLSFSRLKEELSKSLKKALDKINIKKSQSKK